MIPAGSQQPDQSRWARWRGQGADCLKTCWALIRPMGNPVYWWRAVWTTRPLAGAALVLAVALPWYVSVGMKTNGRWLMGFLGRHNFERFTQPMEGHDGSIYFYVVAILVGFFPWSIFLPIALIQTWQQFRSGTSPNRTGEPSEQQASIPTAATIRGSAFDRLAPLFLLAWITVYVVFFTMARTKLPSYVLPCYPGLALLVGRWVANWVAQPGTVPSWVAPTAFGILRFVGIAGSVILPIAAWLVIPGESGIGVIAIFPIVGGTLALMYARRQMFSRAINSFAVASLLLTFSMFAAVAPHVDQHQTSHKIAAQLKLASGKPQEIFFFRCFLPGVVFYTHQQVEDVHTPEKLQEWINRSPNPVLVTRADEFEKVQHLLPDMEVLTHTPLFLRPHVDVILVARRNSPLPMALAAEKTRDRK